MYSNDRTGTFRPGRLIGGLICLWLGVIGLVMPLLPGIPLLIVGALLLRRPRGHRAQRHDRRGHAHYSAAATRYGDAPVPTSRGGLSALEKLELQFWLAARRVTASAESLRLARRARQRGY